MEIHLLSTKIHFFLDSLFKSNETPQPFVTWIKKAEYYNKPKSTVQLNHKNNSKWIKNIPKWANKLKCQALFRFCKRNGSLHNYIYIYGITPKRKAVGQLKKTH